MEPDLIGARLAELREAKQKAEIELRVLAPTSADSEAPDAAALLARLPDLGQALRDAPPAIKHQVFDAFGLQVVYDTLSRRIEISATITEAIAAALENAKDLPEEVSSVTQKDIAGARFVPRSDAQIKQQYRRSVEPTGLVRDASS